MVVVARLVAPLAAARRLVVLVPPLVYREAGFARAARILKVLAAQKGLRILVVVTEEDRAEVEERLRAARPEAALDLEAVPTWTDAMKTVDGIVQTGDVIVLIGVRHGAVAWRPALQRLPRVLARRHDDIDLLSITLSEAEVVPLVAEAVDGDGIEDLVLPPEHVVIDLEARSPEAMLRQILTDGFPDQPGLAARLATQLAADADDAPEVMPGVVFYHAHVLEVDAPQVHVGVCPAGAPLPHTGQPARVILVLLAPDAMPAEAYLKHLSITAQLVRSQSTVGRAPRGRDARGRPRGPHVCRPRRRGDGHHARAVGRLIVPERHRWR